MKLFALFLVESVLTHGGQDGHADHQSEIIEAFLKEERILDIRTNNCDQSGLPTHAIDSIWKCNSKGSRCKLMCQTAAKPKPRPIFQCKKNGNSYQWVEKYPGTITVNMCEVIPPCGILDPVANGGVWACNPKMMTCRLTCPGKYPEWEDEGPRLTMKCKKKKKIWYTKTKNFEKKMNCQAHLMYDTEIIGGITVHIEQGMDNYHDTWRDVLTRDIERVIDALPGPALEIVKDTRIYLHKKYIYPGKTDSDGAAVYHPGAGWLIANGNLREKERCIDLYDVNKYVDWRNNWQSLMLLHEFTHAYHHRILNTDNWGNRIRARYNDAMDDGLYTGKYASTNDWEYLAETSEAFFSAEEWRNEREEELRNDGYPFRVDELKSYDREGYDFLGEMWGVKHGGRNSNLTPFCFEVLDNPREGEPGYDIFTKYIRVLDTFEIYAEPGISNEFVRHAAAVAAELLDNDEDGVIDDEWLGYQLRERNAVMPIFEEEDSNAEHEFWDDFEEGEVFATLYEEEMDPDHTGAFGKDATVEEILHTINRVGHANVYPWAFKVDEDGEYRSTLANAMDVARGGFFTEIPSEYPPQSWYGYHDDTCEYDCMAFEYLYWGIVSNMGLMAQDCDSIKGEWRACLVDDFRRRDHRLYDLLSNFVVSGKHIKFPQWAPNGNYRRSREC